MRFSGATLRVFARSARRSGGLGLPTFRSGPPSKVGRFAFGLRSPRRATTIRAQVRVYRVSQSAPSEKCGERLVLLTTQVLHVEDRMELDMSNPLAALSKRKREIERQIKELERELKDINKVLAPVEKMGGKYLTKERSGGSSSEGGLPKPHQGPKPAEVLAIVDEIIREAAKPQTRGELMQALLQRGVVFAGKNPANTLGTTLSRPPYSKTFINLPGFGYWLRKLPYPPAKHVADGEDREPPGEASDAHHIH